MSKRAWLTPDCSPETRRCWRVFVPDCEEHEAVLRGALVLLSQASNWEKHGTTTPEDAAQAWVNANYETFGMESCQEGGDGVAIGTVFWFASETPPEGALLCDGDSVSTTTYAALYAVIGNTFGGDASNFNLPSLRGEFVRGSSDTEDIADTGGEDEVQLSVAELPAHQHLYNKGAAAGGVPASSALATIRKIGTWLTDTAGSNYPHENKPPYVALAPMIQAS